MSEALKTLSPGQTFWTFDHRSPETSGLLFGTMLNYGEYLTDIDAYTRLRRGLAAGMLYASAASAEQARQRRILKTAYSRDMKNLICRNCIFYRVDGDDTGTCSVADIVVEPQQEACNNYQHY